MAYCRFCGKHLEDENKGCSCPGALAEVADRQAKNAAGNVSEAVQAAESTVGEVNVELKEKEAPETSFMQTEAAGSAAPQEAEKAQSMWREVPQQGGAEQSMPQQAMPSEQGYQQTYTAAQPYQQTQAAAGQGMPQQTTPPQQGYQQPYVAQQPYQQSRPQGMPQQGYAQGAGATYHQGMPQQTTPPVYHSPNMTAQTVKDAVESRNFLQEIKALLKSPSSGVADMIRSKDYLLPGILILVHAAISALFSLLIGLKMDDTLEGMYVNPVLSIFITLVLSVIVSVLYAASVLLAARLLRLELSINNAFSIAGLRSLMVIPFALLGFLFVSLSLGLGMFLFYLPLYLSPLVYANALRAMEADKDKSMRASVVAAIIFIVLFSILSRMMFGVYFPGVNNMMKLFGGGFYGY